MVRTQQRLRFHSTRFGVTKWDHYRNGYATRFRGCFVKLRFETPLKISRNSSNFSVFFLKSFELRRENAKSPAFLARWTAIKHGLTYWFNRMFADA